MNLLFLQKERSKQNLPATPTPPTRPPGDDARDVPAQGLRSIEEPDKAAQSVLRLAAQNWVKSEESKGRIDFTKKWNDEEGVADPNSNLSKGLYHFANIKQVTTTVMEKLVKTYCESRYVTLTSV